MTEQEAIKEVKRWTSILLSEGAKCVSETAEAQDMAIKALEEIQKYRAIGTPEECRAAVEKQKAKKPQKVLLLHGTGYECKWCGNELSVNAFNGEYCHWCGQKLDWSDEDDD